MTSYIRLFEGFRDFGSSFIYYWGNLLGIDGLSCTVNNLPKTKMPSIVVLPVTQDLFAVKLRLYGKMLITSASFSLYGQFLLNILYYIFNGAQIVIALVLILYIIGLGIEKKKNNDYGSDTKIVSFFRRSSRHICAPIKNFIINFFDYLKRHKYYIYTLVTVWFFNLNLATITIEFFSYYYYFCASFDFINLYIQLYKLLLDLAVPLTKIHPLILCVAAVIILDLWRHHKAQAIIDKYEKKDEELVKALPLVIMATGSMGTQKTTFITDVALTKQKLLRDEAYDKLVKCYLRFPHFPWIVFEKHLQQLMKRHVLYNLYGFRHYIDFLQATAYHTDPHIKRCMSRHLRRHYNYKHQDYLYGYDSTTYPTSYCDNLTNTDIYYTLSIYAQVYYIYTLQSSIIISNYGIRSDETTDECGNFPIRDNKFFKRDPKKQATESQYSKVIDYDAIRLGRHIVSDNPYSNAFDFGVYVVTEIGKERGNTKENADLEKKSGDANQKNDYFDLDLMLFRHKSTVDYYPFISFITDDQRPENWGAKARDVAEIYAIDSSSDYKLPPLIFALDELLYRVVWALYSKFFKCDRYYKGNNGAFMYIATGFSNFFIQHYIKLESRYSSSKVAFKVQNGTLDGNSKTLKYFLIKSKIHADRFDTAAFRGFYDYKYSSAKVGLSDRHSYNTTTASMNEFNEQGSYLIQTVNKAFIDNSLSQDEAIDDAEASSSNSPKKRGRKPKK
jgi:hypothetical protein